MSASAMTVDEEAILLATIRAAKAGDQRAFEDLMIATEHRVAVVAWRILADREEVKEAVQETFLRLWRHLSRYDESRDFNGWLFRIAVNASRDLERRRRRRRFFFAPIEEASLAVAHGDAAAKAAGDDEVALLTRAIDDLPPKERLAVLLREVEERPTEEVAAILGVRESTVRVQVRNARLKLRHWIEAHRRGEGRR